MSGLFRTLNIGSESLSVTRMGVDTAGHNIANAQVDGYSRQRVNVRARAPQDTRGVLLGAGAYSESIERAHDQWNEKQLNRANQSAGASNARLAALRQLEGIFSPDLQSAVDVEISNFFNAAQNLSSFPDDVTVRTSFREASRSLAQAFHRVDAGLERERIDLNQRIGIEVSQIDDAMQQIARLNAQIQEQEVSPGAKANDLRDERDRMLREITRKIDISYYENDRGMICVRGPGDSMLVDGVMATHLYTEPNPSNGGLFDIRVEGSEGGMDFTLSKHVGSGELSAMLEVRDKLIPGLSMKNNKLAASMTESINSVHQQGFGVGEFQHAAGRNLFKPVGDISTAAAKMAIDDSIEASTDAISFASTPMAAGDNVIGNRLLSLKDTKILDGRADFQQFYADMIGEFGTEVLRAEHVNEAEEVLVKDLQNRRESVSGVSLDEEATNLMRWQANFAASSKLITTVDEMLETVLSIKR
jgi:flagellar hook-associated protein 1 FlgK